MLRRRCLALVAAVLCAACAAKQGTVEVEIQAPAAGEPLVAVARARPPAADDAGLIGQWVGVGHQSGGSSWQMIVDVGGTGPGVCAHVRYPSLPCAAEWTCIVSARPGSMRGVEHVTEGQDACIDGGEIAAELTREGHLAWSWKESGESAHAMLSRGRARDADPEPEPEP